MIQPEKPIDSNEAEMTYFNFSLIFIFSLSIALSIIWPSSIKQLLVMADQLWYYNLLLFFFSISYMLISLVEYTSVELDKRCKWEDGFLKRAFLQMIFGGVCATGLTLLFCWLYFHFFNINVYRLLHIRHIFLIVVMVNMMYGFYYYVKLVHAGVVTSKKGKQENQYRDYFIVPDGLTSITLKLTDIAYLVREGRDVNVKTLQGRSHPIWLALDDTQKELDPNLFFRLNRTHIVSKDAYVSSKKNDKKGLDVVIIHKSGEPDGINRELKTIELSREKVHAFKTWIRNKK